MCVYDYTKILQCQGCRPQAKEWSCQEAIALMIIPQLWDQLIVLNWLMWRHHENIKGLQSSHSADRSLGLKGCIIRDRVLRDLHGGAMSGHFGETRPQENCKSDSTHWPGLYADIKLYIYSARLLRTVPGERCLYLLLNHLCTESKWEIRCMWLQSTYPWPIAQVHQKQSVHPCFRWQHG